MREKKGKSKIRVVQKVVVVCSEKRRREGRGGQIGVESREMPVGDTARRIEAIKIASLVLEIGLQCIPARVQC